jgi:hypothetical protein
MIGWLIVGGPSAEFFVANEQKMGYILKTSVIHTVTAASLENKNICTLLEISLEKSSK